MMCIMFMDKMLVAVIVFDLFVGVFVFMNLDIIVFDMVIILIIIVVIQGIKMKAIVKVFYIIIKMFIMIIIIMVK